MARARVLLAVMVGALSALFWVAPAQAHNSLTASSPADGARVATAPEAVTLTFLARLRPDGTTVSVTGPDGAEVTTGAPSVSRNKVTARLRPGAAGRYTVTYRVASRDGHTVKGDVQFTASTGASAAPATSPPPSSAPSSPAPAVPDPAVVASTAGLDRMTAEEVGTTWWPWAVGATLLVAAGAATYLVRRRAR